MFYRPGYTYYDNYETNRDLGIFSIINIQQEVMRRSGGSLSGLYRSESDCLSAIIGNLAYNGYVMSEPGPAATQAVLSVEAGRGLVILYADTPRRFGAARWFADQILTPLAVRDCQQSSSDAEPVVGGRALKSEIDDMLMQLQYGEKSIYQLYLAHPISQAVPCLQPS